MRQETSFEQALSTMESALNNVQAVPKPFPHFAIPDLFDADTASAVLNWLEQDVPWTVESRKFYVQDVCTGVTQRASGSPAAVVGAPETLQCMRKHLERIFGVTLNTSHFDLVAHRMLPGHRIGIHTDTPGYETETHRLLINLNAGFDDEQGGHLILLDMSDLEDSAVVVRPVHNSAVGMEFSDHSWHCVDEIKSGKRYSLVYSFWVENWETDSSTAEATRDGFGTVTEQELNDMRSLLREMRVDAVPHTSRSLMDHVDGVYQILKQWQCDRDICKAGLFHFSLGTPMLQPFADEQIDRIRTLIGERAMFLVMLYSRADLPSLRRIVSGDKFTHSGGTVALTLRDTRSLVSLVWANILEQSRYVPLAEGMDAELKQLFKETSHLLPPQSDKNIRSLLSLSTGH